MIKISELFTNRRRIVVIAGVLCLTLLGIILLTNVIKDQGDEGISLNAGITQNAQELIDYKTSYVGDNVRVVNLVNKLSYGDSVKEVLLQTKIQPYGVIVEYAFKDLITDKERLRNAFEANATIMFAMIDNVDNITLKCNGSNEPIEFTYLRSELQMKYNIELREYSKDVNMLEKLLESLIFRVSVFPKKYALTMSSTPGMNLSAYYYGTEIVEKVRFSTESGILFNWDTATGKISEGKQTVEVLYGNGIYWSPISGGNNNPSKVDNIITVTFWGGGKVIGEKQVIITTDEFFNYTVKSDLHDNQSQNPQSIEEAVRHAIKSRATAYKTGEFASEGHIILDIEDKGSTVKVYTIASIGNFGFENGIFTVISGSGAIPTVITLSNDEKNKFELLEYKEPQDGGGYGTSIKKMFPNNLLEEALGAHKYSTELVKQQEAQAVEYLKSIGRVAKVSASHVDKVLIKTNVDASNKLLEIATYSDYPYWIGSIEQIEGGIRYIYETSQSKTSDGYDLVIFKKADTAGNVIKQVRYKIVGSEPQLVE